MMKRRRQVHLSETGPGPRGAAAMGRGLPEWVHWMGLDLLPQLPASGTHGYDFQLRREQRTGFSKMQHMLASEGCCCSIARKAE